MSADVVALDRSVQGTESAIVELRREAVNAVARQQQIRDELGAVSPVASDIERRAERAFARGDDLLARQILARGIVTLKTRDALEAELADSRGRLARLLDGMVRAENRAWCAIGAPRR